jgi:ADP-ribose pyrophosphatase YjhB (NUDIX family)
VAIEMLALITDASLESLEPLRATVFARPCPLVAGDAAVIDDTGRILLIRRRDNKRWAMPGGYLEPGETPAEGAVREAQEETGLFCRAVSLVGVFDSRLHGTVGAHHLYQFVFLCEPLERAPAEKPPHGVEVLETAWFSEDALPDEQDPGHVSRIPHAYRVWRGEECVFWDGCRRG